jgi:hypothetical protein
MEFKFRYVWIFPYAVLVSMPYFIEDIWDTLCNLYNNVSFETMFLYKEYATEDEDESGSSETEESEKED